MNMPASLRAVTLAFPLVVLCLAAAALGLSSGTARAACTTGDPPCVTRLADTKVGDKHYIHVHYRGACKFDHYNLAVVGGPHVKITEKRNPNVLCSSQPALYGPVERGKRYTFSISGCESPTIGKDKCTPFSAPVTHFAGARDLVLRRQCHQYASQAVGIRKEALERYKCAPHVISGPRWTPNFSEHLDWCMGVSAQLRNFETSERNKILHQCRIQAGRPQGTPFITVTTPPRGTSFTINGTGFAPNARVNIDVSGPVGRRQTITNNFANKDGVFSVTLTDTQVCNKAGIVTFTARDLDKPPSPPVNARCKP